jgi:hypothetical protein
MAAEACGGSTCQAIRTSRQTGRQAGRVTVALDQDKECLKKPLHVLTGSGSEGFYRTCVCRQQSSREASQLLLLGILSA